MRYKRMLQGVLLWLAASSVALAQGPPPPAAVPIIQVAAQIQTSANTGIGLRLTAQLVQTASTMAPYKSLPVTIASYVLTPAASAPAYAATCSLTNSSKMLECSLAPTPGPGWSNDNPLALSVQLTSTSGAVATTLATFSGGANPGVQANLQAGTGTFPAATNNAPIYLSAQMTRNVINLTPIESSPLVLSSWSLTEATFSPAANLTGCALTSASTLLECTLVPLGGGLWGGGGPIVIRVELTASDGAKGTALAQFRLN